MSKANVFISYSHKDEIWKDRLLTHLKVFEEEGLLETWDDRRIGEGKYPHSLNAVRPKVSTSFP